MCQHVDYVFGLWDKGASTGRYEMFKIQIRENGQMVDYNSKRFDDRESAGKYRTAEKCAKGIFADMRVVRA